MENTLELVTNFKSDHKSALTAVLKGANRVEVAVAFLKKEGASVLAKILTNVLKDGGGAAVFVGTDFFLTEPEALNRLLNLSLRNSALSIRISDRRRQSFHPKVYAGFSGAGFRCLTGSANLTGGALTTNVEASILLRGSIDDLFGIQLLNFFEVLNKDARYRKLDAEELAEYKVAWTPVDKKRKELEETIATAEQRLVSLPDLDKFYSAYLAKGDVERERQLRRENRAKAIKVQKNIARLDNAGLSTAKLKTQLRHLLNDLMSGKDGGRHLWASDAIFRKGSASIKKPKQTVKLFARAASVVQLPVKQGYNEVRELALAIPGVGTNMVTEILSTFASNTHPVINGNTRAALKCVGFTFAGAHSLNAFKPDRYGEVVEMIAGVRDRIGAADFTETDAFLDWVFQQNKRNRKSKAKA